MNLPQVRLNYFTIECVDWILNYYEGFQSKMLMTGARQGFSKHLPWMHRNKAVVILNVMQFSCYNFLEVKSTAWLRSVSFIHIFRFEKINRASAGFLFSDQKSETRCAAWMGILFMKLLSWLSCIMVRSLTTLVLTKWWRHLEIDHQAEVVRGVPGSVEH